MYHVFASEPGVPMVLAEQYKNEVVGDTPYTWVDMDSSEQSFYVPVGDEELATHVDTITGDGVPYDTVGILDYEGETYERCKGQLDDMVTVYLVTILV